ncbi:hypothetical protein C8Q70DRAFT_17399 [Cubamyces menziesii]|uniref:Uncharacterized protein n=1 Tax=Trametes cubensis TaxID=1111947 RepID=A0AAD7TKP9_9APHY|nr:hypothetical protein C8Q70DRAFT_17399 [Cubamyces menziesii]KAJ8463166.1 hypothetical protein ONZ51_g10433 [Trametes cubensis]
MHPTLVFSAALLASLLSAVRAQTLVNGQIFTNGLAIVDAPAPNSPMHAGSVTQVAIDISGDGKLDQSASIPGSDKSTRFDSLEIYLVSYQTKLNLTVSSGPGLLTQEQGSTVKHWDYNVSTCIPAGSYNLTFYEASHINDQPCFSITAYPVTVMNDHPTDACSNGTNPLQSFPQLSSPPPHSPWLDGTSIATQPLPTATGSNSANAVVATGAPIALAFLGLLSLLSL